VVDELKIQVEELQVATSHTESRLQRELELLRERKREEDLVRAELKSRTKVLEEQKRTAESGRVEAEREVGERKAITRRIGERVHRIRDEMNTIDRRRAELVERKEKKKRDKKERERKLREDVGRKQEELRVAEGGMEKLLEEVKELGNQVDGRKELIAFKRNDLTLKGIQIYGSTTSYQSPQQQHHLYYQQQYPSSRPASLREHSSSTPNSPSSPYPHGVEDDSPIARNLTTFYPLPVNTLHYSPVGFGRHRQESQQLQLQHHQSQYHVQANPPGPVSTFEPFDFDYYDSPGPIEPSPFENRGESTSLRLDQFDPSASARPLPSASRDSTSDNIAVATALVQQQQDMLSPVTPHPTSLIPASLFEMLDEEDDDVSNRPRNNFTQAGEEEEVDEGDDEQNLNENGDAREDVTATMTTTNWVSKDELLLSPSSYNKLSHLQDFSLAFASSSTSTTITSDDFPRHAQGLSLNPDAKSFSFQHLPPPKNSTTPIITSNRPRSITSTMSPKAATTTTFGLHDDLRPAPAKSRMDFAIPSLSNPGHTSTSSIFNWQRHSAKPSSSSSSGSTKASHGVNAAGKGIGFSPFDEMDDLLK
jgi:hypothetical protein